MLNPGSLLGRGGEKPGEINLDSAVVAITGGARGIGLATAEQFAERGANVCIGDLDVAQAKKAAKQIGSLACAFELDVTSRWSFHDFIVESEKKAGPIDVLVNNAGIMPTGSFLEEDRETTRRIYDVNVMGLVNGMQQVLPGMIERGRGHVVNVASMFGKTEAPGAANYIASKHAAVGLSNAVRSELKGTDVTITTILPGVVNTELIAGIEIPLARIMRVEPEDIAEAIVDSVDNRREEIAVPHWMGTYAKLRPLIPRVLERAVRELVGEDRMLTGTDHEIRQTYTSRIDR